MKTRTQQFVAGMILAALLMLSAIMLWEWTHPCTAGEPVYYDYEPIEQDA